MPQTIIGVDIAKRKFDVARLCEHKYRHKKFDHNAQGFVAFLDWLNSFGDPQPWVCMEATGAYSVPLAEFLVERGYRVSVVNPAKIHAFAKSELSRTKTDKVDAKLIARYCLSLQPDRWTPPPRAIRELQALLRRVEHLLEMQQMERNRLATADPAIVASLKTVLDMLDKELEETRQRIKSLIDNDPDLRQRRHLLESIPGIGPAASAYLLTALSPHYGFSSAKQAVAYAGLAPAIQKSGKWVGKTRLSKTGDPALRKALYLPALVAWQYNPIIRTFCQRLKDNGKNGKAIVCAAMRKLIHIAFAILQSGKPFDPKLSLA
ncbi:IS110 family transposase [Methylocaldum sp.]|uniref:IS110 family transposase n=1 Tax=Methylocaldum sp. TaxID=1969727 RepID=UPI002D6BF5A5|nr:IS110 family transposase [Methylocaldum sp.]HYE37146.1 IS110 family transposase [Methylocaldum sp.]